MDGVQFLMQDSTPKVRLGTWLLASHLHRDPSSHERAAGTCLRSLHAGQLRDARLRELQAAARQRAELHAAGHGAVRNLPEHRLLREAEQCTQPLVCHLALNGSSLDDELDEHLASLAHRFLGTRFVRTPATLASTLHLRLRTPPGPGACSITRSRQGPSCGRAPEGSAAASSVARWRVPACPCCQIAGINCRPAACRSPVQASTPFIPRQVQACCASSRAAWWVQRAWTALAPPTAYRKRLWTSGCGGWGCWPQHPAAAAQRQRRQQELWGKAAAAAAKMRRMRGRMIGSSPARCAGADTRTSTYARCTRAESAARAARQTLIDASGKPLLLHVQPMHPDRGASTLRRRSRSPMQPFLQRLPLQRRVTLTATKEH